MNTMHTTENQTKHTTNLAAARGVGNAEVRGMLRQVRQFIERNADARFVWWHCAAGDRDASALDTAGFRRLVPPIDGAAARTEYFILPGVFRAEACQGFNPAAVCHVLARYGALALGDGRHFDKRMRLPGIGNARCFHILPALMDVEA